MKQIFVLTIYTRKRRIGNPFILLLSPAKMDYVQFARFFSKKPIFINQNLN